MKIKIIVLIYSIVMYFASRMRSYKDANSRVPINPIIRKIVFPFGYNEYRRTDVLMGFIAELVILSTMASFLPFYNEYAYLISLIVLFVTFMAGVIVIMIYELILHIKNKKDDWQL